MLFSNSLAVIAAISSCVYGSPTFGNTKIVESLKSAPAGWTRDESIKLDKDGILMRLRIHLTPQDMNKFHDLAMNIATPGHALYGQHLDQQALNAMIAPKDDSKDLVEQWLKSAGLGEQSSISPRADSIIVEASIAQVEKLLNAEYEAFVNEESGAATVRTLEYSLPSTLKGHVDMVQPTTFFGLHTMRSMVQGERLFNETHFNSEAISAVTGCTGSTVTPKCLSNLYSFAGATAYSNGLMGIAGFLEQYPIKTDLTTFLKSYATEGNAAHTFTCTLVNGGTCPQTASGAGVEANLDVQYAAAITESIPNTYYSVGGRPPIVGTGTNTNEPYLEFLDYLLGLPTASLPNTLSISYGDDEATVPLSYATNVCNLFSQLGARGVSILVASGDSGVGTTCKSSSGAKSFTTSFPAGCPWVTTVGGTTGNSPEAAWTDSGSGFSEIFGQPSYQAAAVNNWLTTDTTHTAVSSYFNQSGRAYPDVSAQSTNFVIVVSGTAELVDGTSCATPTFASVIQLLNSDRLGSGKSALGFLNPWLYSNATSGLTDIKTGKNSGCSGVISGAGFSAVTGWDPVTGLGTPIYTTLLSLARALA